MKLNKISEQIRKLLADNTDIQCFAILGMERGEDLECAIIVNGDVDTLAEMVENGLQVFDTGKEVH